MRCVVFGVWCVVCGVLYVRVCVCVCARVCVHARSRARARKRSDVSARAGAHVPAHAFGRGRVLAVAGLWISLARIVKQWLSFWFHFLVTFLCQFLAHPDVTNNAKIIAN